MLNVYLKHCFGVLAILYDKVSYGALKHMPTENGFHIALLKKERRRFFEMVVLCLRQELE